MPTENIDIIRSKRRTLAIEITDAARILVRAPLRLSQRDIDMFVAQNARWITQKYDDAVRRASLRTRREFTVGETLPLSGASYPILQIHSSRVRFDHGFILPDVPVAQRAQKLEEWYRSCARNHFTARADHYADSMDISYSEVRLSSAKSRWGSASSKGSINIHWRLIMAPPSVIDYVIVHELAHLVHMNHSQRFWSLVTRFHPDHHHAKKWLNEYGSMLTLTAS